MMPCVGMPCVGRPGGAWYGGIVCGIGGAQPAGKGGAPGKGIWYPGGWPLHDSAPPGAPCSPAPCRRGPAAHPAAQLPKRRLGPECLAPPHTCGLR